MPLDLAITDADIVEGVRKDCESCPVALALSRAGGSAAVVGQDIEVDIDGVRRNFGIPPELVNFILDFDDGRPVEPISCTLYEC